MPGFSQVVTVSFKFDQPSVIDHQGYQLVEWQGMLQSAMPGDPMIPWQSVSALLPPGCEATSVEVILSHPEQLAGTFSLFPRQYSRPISEGVSGKFVKNETVYNSKSVYPAEKHGRVSTHFYNGHAVAFTAFSPLAYVPASGQLTWYREAEVTLTYTTTEKGTAALRNCSASETVSQTLRHLVQNPDDTDLYNAFDQKSNPVGLLVITPEGYQEGYAALLEYYATLGITSEIVTTEDIYTSQTGVDNQEKIRNYIIGRVQTDGVDYLLLGGDVELVPARGLFCQVNSQGSIYEDISIPADLYYSALDGTWNDNGNNLWGEPDEDDLLPDLAVARLPYGNVAEQTRMLHKVLNYQQNPVDGELTNTLMAGEDLYSNPQTWGADYLEMLIGHHEDNGYTTDGIPEAFPIQEMYDRDMGYWSKRELIDKINTGMTFIHHSGHSNVDYALRMSIGDITDANFNMVNGVDHNYCLIYTHGCICGAFDASDCIAEEMLKIQNFVVAGSFNSRYGWFNEGQTEGPSLHLHREFVNALYTLGIDRIGQTQVQSKIATAPWVEAPGQWEDGALRWCFYDNNIFGDAAMKIHTDNYTSIDESIGKTKLDIFPNPANDFIRLSVPVESGNLESVKIYDLSGKMVTNIHFSLAKISTFEVRIELNTLPNGTYILRAETQKAVFSNTLTIVR
ncbi:MAG: hypothetical protein A2X09_12750 [Bacteroidetes bacterium GWF2_43_11]|nr:MAG: hypothetical protein A2X09_12750 [Bacteroidetes bacterium GWF2_43_11]